MRSVLFFWDIMQPTLHNVQVECRSQSW